MNRCAMLALLGAVAACRREVETQEEPVPVEVHCVPAVRESVEVVETLAGRIAAPPGGDLPVAAQVPGRIARVLVHEGDRVASGTPVAEIDGASSQDALRQAEATLVQAKAAQANADATLGRTRELVARGIAAKQELDDATSHADQARAGVSAAQAASDQARRVLGRVEVRSSFEGLVTRVWRGAGALVDGTAATPIVELAASTRAEFDGDATEGQLQQIAPGQDARVTLASTGGVLEGSVQARSSALDPATGLGLVRLTIDAKTPLLLGQFGSALVHVGTREGVLLVPEAAMRGAIADGAEVVVCDRGKAQVRPVHVGWRGDAGVEVTGGLAPGERVATDRVLGLENGSPLLEAK